MTRMRKVDPRGLFPVLMPAAANRAFVCFCGCGLLVYRVNHKAPLVSLLQTTARSQLVQSVLTPIVHAMEKDLQRTVSLVTKPDTPGDDSRADAAAQPPDDLWQSGDEKQNNPPEAQQDHPAAGDDQNQDQNQQAPGNQNGTQSADSQQQQSDSQQAQEGQKSTSSSPQVRAAGCEDTMPKTRPWGNR